MLDALYRRRLEHDLQVWRERGWVTPEAATAILGTVEVDGRPRTAIIVGFLGAILIAFAAIAFVAANWVDMARPIRLAILVGGMTLCYGTAVFLNRARHPWFADAAVFAGAALFGAAIMLVAQSYHISGDYPDALLMWGAGALFAAVFGPSRAALALSIIVLGLWSWYETFDYDWIIHWPFLIALALIAIVSGAWNWRQGMHLVVLALGTWIAVVAIRLAEHLDWSAAAVACVSMASALAMFAAGRYLTSRTMWPRTGRFGTVLSIYGLFAFLALFILLQLAMREGPSPDYADDRVALIAAVVLAGASTAFLIAACSTVRAIVYDAALPIIVAFAAVGLTWAASTNAGLTDSLALQVLLGILALVAGIWAVANGNRRNSRASATFGLLAFAGEVLYLYFVTFGTLLNTALFFLIGGILLIALAAVLVRLQRRLSPQDPGETHATDAPVELVETGDPS